MSGEGAVELPSPVQRAVIVSLDEIARLVAGQPAGLVEAAAVLQFIVGPAGPGGVLRQISVVIASRELPVRSITWSLRLVTRGETDIDVTGRAVAVDELVRGFLRQHGVVVPDDAGPSWQVGTLRRAWQVKAVRR